MKRPFVVAAFAAFALYSAPATAQDADWQLDPLPLLQGEWEYWGPADNASWGGYAKIRIEGRKVTMVDALHPDYYGSPWTKVPAGALIMTIERWTQDSTTRDSQLIIRGTCYDYSNSNGRPGSCWHVLTKYNTDHRNRQSKAISWGFSIFERLRDGATGAAGYASLPASKGETHVGGTTQLLPAKIRQRPDVAQERREAAERLAASQAAESSAVRDLNAGLARDAHARNAAFTKGRDDARAAMARHEAEVAAIVARNAAAAADHARQVAAADAAQRSYRDALEPKAKPGRQCTTRSFSQVMSDAASSEAAARKTLALGIARRSGANIGGSESVVSMSGGAPSCSQRTIDEMKRPPVGKCFACITEQMAAMYGYIPGKGWPPPETEWICKATVQITAERCKTGPSKVSNQ